MRKLFNNNLTLAILSFALVMCLIVGGTLAYLTDVTEKRANNFTFGSADIDAHLVEPNWDGIVDYEYQDDGSLIPIYGYDDDDNPIYGYYDNDPEDPITEIEDAIEFYEGDEEGDLRPIDADGNNPATGEKYGDEAAEDMIPGAVALKNPVIFNSGTAQDIWVAAKVTFVYGPGHPVAEKRGKPLSVEDYAKVTDAITIDWEYDATGKWEEDEAYTLALAENAGISRILYYTDRFLNKVAADADPGVYDTTAPIFTSLTVKGDATNAEIEALKEMGGFVIYIEGFAVQTGIFTDGDGFLAWGKTDDNVHFDNSPAADYAVDVEAPGITPKPTEPTTEATTTEP